MNKFNQMVSILEFLYSDVEVKIQYSKRWTEKDGLQPVVVIEASGMRGDDPPCDFHLAKENSFEKALDEALRQVKLMIQNERTYHANSIARCDELLNNI